LLYRFGNIEIARIGAVPFSSQGHCGCVQETCGSIALEPARRERSMPRAEPQQVNWRDGDPSVSGYTGQEILPCSDIVNIIARRKLGDPKHSILSNEVRLRPSTTQGAPRRQQQRQRLLFFKVWLRRPTLELLSPMFQIAKTRFGRNRHATSFQELARLWVRQPECANPHFVIDAHQVVPVV